MSKKQVIEVNLYNDAERDNLFKNGFLVALKENALEIKGEKVYIETSDIIYIADLYRFTFIWNPSFEHIFSNEFPDLFQINNMQPRAIKTLYEWTNPFFDELPVKVRAKDEFLKDLQTKLKNDEEYYQVVREAALNQIIILDLDARKAYLDRLIPLGILTENDKIQLEYYSDCSADTLDKTFKEKNMSADDQLEIVSQAFALERRKQALSERKSKKTYNNRIVQLVNLLPVSEILDVYLSGVLTVDEFIRTKVTKKDLLASPYEMLLEILSEKNDSLPDKLKITSKDLVNAYGRSLNGGTIFKLSAYGYIEPQDLIEVYEINKVLRSTDYDESIFENEELKAYYTPTILIGMKRDEKLSPRFIQKYLEMQDFENNPELFETKSRLLIEELKREEEDDTKLKDDVLYFFDIGLCDLEITKENVSEDDIELKFVENELSIGQVFEYYQKGLLGDDAISKYYTASEILEMYVNGSLNGRCLRAIKEVDLLLQAYCDGKIVDSDFINLYLESDNLTVNDLDDAIQLAERDVDVSYFIDESTSFEKIKELFSAVLIDYASILGLHNQGLINDDELEEIKSTLSTREFFAELREGKKYKVVTSREGQSTSRRTRAATIEKDEDDFSDELALISEILGKDVEQEPYSLIESYNSKGRVTSLNNYRIFGNEELDGIVILQKSKKENAVYVMSVLQMMYFLKGKENSNGEIEIQNRMKDKAYLKTIEGVEVVEHTEYFSRNLVEAASRISPKVAEKVKDENSKYIASVDIMIAEMIQKYLDSKVAKVRGRDDD